MESKDRPWGFSSFPFIASGLIYCRQNSTMSGVMRTGLCFIACSLHEYCLSRHLIKQTNKYL